MKNIKDGTFVVVKDSLYKSKTERYYGLAPTMLKMQGKVYEVISVSGHTVRLKAYPHEPRTYNFHIDDIEPFEFIEKSKEPVKFDPTNLNIP